MEEDKKSIKKRIVALRKKIKEASDAYYKHNKSIMSDIAYDGYYDRLVDLERKYPEFNDPNSPTNRIGSDLK